MHAKEFNNFHFQTNSIVTVFNSESPSYVIILPKIYLNFERY